MSEFFSSTGADGEAVIDLSCGSGLMMRKLVASRRSVGETTNACGSNRRCLHKAVIITVSSDVFGSLPRTWGLWCRRSRFSAGKLVFNEGHVIYFGKVLPAIGRHIIDMHTLFFLLLSCGGKRIITAASLSGLEIECTQHRSRKYVFNL